MPEELKPEEKKEEEGPKTGKAKAIVKTILKVILGIILIALGACFVWIWRRDLLMVVKGCLGLFLVLAGIITLAIAKE